MHMIEELIDHKAELSILDDKDMEEISDILRHVNPNLRGPAFEDSVFFQGGEKIEIGSFLLQKSIYGHCRIVKKGESENVRLAHGAESLLMKFISMKVIEKKHLPTVTDKEYGIVFGGGGARGAYEIGVWKALEEAGLSKRITGISGSSVGALNALLFAQGDLTKAEEVWRSVEKKDLTQWDKLIHVKDYRTAGAESEMNPDIVVSEAVNMIRSVSVGVFSNNLRSIIDDSIDNWKKLEDNKIVYACATLRGYPSILNAEKKFAPEWLKAVYFPLVGMNKDDMKEFVIASASIPFAYSKQSIDYASFVDGGVKDTVPYTPLVNAKYRKILVVHLDHRKCRKNHIERKQDSCLYHLCPSSRLGGLLEINETKTQKRMRMGYENMNACLPEIERNWGF